MAEKRRLIVKGNIHIKDFETIGSDEHCNLPIDKMFTLYSDGGYSTLLTERLGCGGECRTEVDVHARLLENGQMQATVYSYFYEGSSEGTSEEEDRKETVDLLIPKSVPTNLTHHLVNVDFPGDDTSTVSLTFTNSPFED
jgi:hypothetical protein